MCVTNGIHLCCDLLLPVGTVNCVQTLKATATQVATLALTLTLNSIQTLKATATQVATLALTLTLNYIQTLKATATQVATLTLPWP
jgi:hypothetical protein